MPSNICICAANSTDDVEAVKQLFIEFSEYLGIDLKYQCFGEGLAKFPTSYDAIFLARVNGAPAACIGSKDLGGGICEMKHLFVRSDFRGHDLGRKLCDVLIEDARTKGYRAMRFDTLPRLTTAIALYRGMGFKDIPRYNENPIKDVVFLELAL